METYQYSSSTQLSTSEQWLWRLYNIFAQSGTEGRLHLRPYLERLASYYGQEELKRLYPHIVSMWEAQGLPPTNYELVYHLTFHRDRVWDKVAGTPARRWQGVSYSVDELFSRLEQWVGEAQTSLPALKLAEAQSTQEAQAISGETFTSTGSTIDELAPKEVSQAEENEVEASGGQGSAEAQAEPAEGEGAPTPRQAIITDWSPEDAILLHKYTLYFFVKSVFASIDSFTKWTLHEQELTLAIEQAQKSEYQEYMPHGLKPLAILRVARALGYVTVQDHGVRLYTFDLEQGKEIESAFRFLVALSYCMASKQIQERWILPHAFSPAVRLALSMYKDTEQVFDPRYTDQVHRFVRHIALQEGILVQSTKAEHGRDDMLSWPQPQELAGIHPLAYTGTLERTVYLSDGTELSGLALFYLFKSLLGRSRRADGGVPLHELKIRHQALTPRYLGQAVYSQIGGSEGLRTLVAIAVQKQIVRTLQEEGVIYVAPSGLVGLVDGEALHRLVRLLFVISSKHRTREEARHLKGIDALYPSLLDIFANIPLPEDWRSFIYIAKQERWISYDEFVPSPRLTLSQEVDPLLYELPLYESAFVAVDAEGHRYTEAGKVIEPEPEREADSSPQQGGRPSMRGKHPIYKRKMSKEEGQPQLHEFCQIADISTRTPALQGLLIQSEPRPWTQLLNLVDTPELWSFDDYGMAQKIVYQPKYNLARYIASLYTRISLSPKEKDRDYILKGKGMQVFNTGLYDHAGDQIYALFFDSQAGKQRPVLLGFGTGRSERIGNYLFTAFAGKLPSLVPLHRTQYGELVYKPEFRTMIFDNCWKHIIHERISRLPVAWLKERLPEGWMEQDPRTMIPADQRAYYTQLQERIGQDMETDREVFARIKEDLQKAFSHSLLRAQMRKIRPIPVYHKGDNRITFLFAISLEADGRIDLVLAMNEDEASNMYVGVTILSLSWAYQSALQSHLSPQEWLSWALVQETAQRHLTEGLDPVDGQDPEPVTRYEGWQGVQKYQFFPPEPEEISLSDSLGRVTFADAEDYEQEDMIPTSTGELELSETGVEDDIED